MKACTVAGVQMYFTPNEPDQNVAKMCIWIEKAKKQVNPDLIVFPETITTGFQTGLDAESLWDLVDTIPGRFTEKIGLAAKENNVYVIFGTYERGAKRGDVYNASVLIDNQGSIVGVYRKTHIYPTERQWCKPGYEAPVFETPFAKIGMVICYDGDYPELSRVIALKGAEIIVRPTALLRSFEIWELTNRARAYDNHVYLVGVNIIGPDAGGNNGFGNSMIVSPVAETLALAPAGETIVYAKLDPDPLRTISYGCTTPMIFHHMEDRNLKAYQGILQEGEMTFPPLREDIRNNR